MFFTKITTILFLVAAALPTSFAEDESFLHATGPCVTTTGKEWEYSLSVFPEPVDDEDGPSATNQVEIDFEIYKELTVSQEELTPLADYTFTVNLSYNMAKHKAKSQVARLIQPLEFGDPQEAEVDVEWAVDYTPAVDGVAEFTAMAVNEAGTVECNVAIGDMGGALAAMFP